MPKNGKTKVDIAVLQTNQKFIMDKLDVIDKKIDNIQMCANTHDSRIQKIEDCMNDRKESQDWTVKKIGILMAVISLGISTLFWVIEHFIGV